jgi:hypothetical protein
MFPTIPDLYIKDCDNDLGLVGTLPTASELLILYACDNDYMYSPDIWIRLNDDGEVNQTNDPAAFIYNSEVNASPIRYVYVRVRNRSRCLANTDGKLALYWVTTEGTRMPIWLNNQPMNGGLIGGEILGIIAPEDERIFTFQINLDNANLTLYNSFIYFLARIEDSSIDPLPTFGNGSYIDEQVIASNNIAMRKMQFCFSPTLDLYIKDHPTDLGETRDPNDYYWQFYLDESPDIIVRNQPDGFANFEHQSPQYSSSHRTVWVYVKVRNKSCVPSNGDEELNLYWSRAATSHGWSQNWIWDGVSYPIMGDRIGIKQIGIIPAGGEKIFEFEWTINDPGADNGSNSNWEQCLLARIENSAVDPIIECSNNLYANIYCNNNIAIKNVFILDMQMENYCGRCFYVGNPEAYSRITNLEFTTPNINTTKDDTFLNVADVFLKFDTDVWDNISQMFYNRKDVQVMSPGTVKVLTPNLVFNNIEWNANQRIPILIEFYFKPTATPSEDNYKYEVREYLVDRTGLARDAGGVHFIIERPKYDYFEAATDKVVSVNYGEKLTLSAIPQNGNFEYNWYDINGNFVGEGVEITINPPTSATQYQLEVVSLNFCARDITNLMVNVNTNFITSVTPNPATEEITVEYSHSSLCKPSVTIQSMLGISKQAPILQKQLKEVEQFVFEKAVPASNQIQLPIQKPQAVEAKVALKLETIVTTKETLNVSDLQPGNYTVQLSCDGVVYDSKNFVKH